MSRPLGYLHGLILACLLACSVHASPTYTLSVVPQFTPVDIGLRWTPLLRRLEADTGLVFQLRIQERIPAFEADFLRGGPDFVYLNPYHMVMASRSQGYVPLVKGAQPLSGILVVDRNGPVKSLADLQHGKLAFPSPNAFGASLYMRALLAGKENLSFVPTYVGTHQNTYRHVLLGEALGGGGVMGTLDREPASIKERLRVLYQTPETPSHPIAAHPRVPVADRERLVRALLAINQDAAGRKLLDDVELAGVMAADFSRDYQPLEKLKLDRYLVLDKK